MGAFKTTSSKLIRRAGLSGFQRQKYFYDHIIRDDADLARVWEYIDEQNHLSSYKFFS
jgi:hypothetical protein